MWRDTMTYMAQPPFVPTTPAPLVEGAGLLGVTIHNTTELIAALERGFEPAIARRLADALALPLTEFGGTVGVAVRTVQRKARGETPLSTDQSETLYRVARILERAERLLRSREKAARWVTTPKFGLGGKTPLEYARTEPGGEAVLDLLDAVADGSVA